MLKKLMLLATAAMAVFAFGAQGASANWFHGSSALKAGENPHINTTGSLSFTSPNGGTSCNTVDSTIELIGGSTTGHIRSFEVTNIGACEISGALVFLTGGTTTLKSATLTGSGAWTPTIHQIIKSGKHHLSVTGLTLHIAYANGFKLTLESAAAPLTAALSNAGGGQTGAIQTLTVTAGAENKLKSGLGEIEITMHGHVANPTYGVTAP